jgi:hypothetical protein
MQSLSALMLSIDSYASAFQQLAAVNGIQTDLAYWAAIRLVDIDDPAGYVTAFRRCEIETLRGTRYAFSITTGDGGTTLRLHIDLLLSSHERIAATAQRHQ